MCFQLHSRAEVIPLPKPKSISTDLNDYRPISILSVFTKPLERHIHKHLTFLFCFCFLETHQFFHSFQYGFRCGHSCQTAVTRLTDTWLSAFNNRQMSDAAFLYFRKAFELVSLWYFTKETILVQLKHGKYNFLTIVPTGSSTMPTCEWHILPRNVYNKWSASRVDPRPASVLHLY